LRVTITKGLFDRMAVMSAKSALWH
jgi:hypothetical protein